MSDLSFDENDSGLNSVNMCMKARKLINVTKPTFSYSPNEVL